FEAGYEQIPTPHLYSNSVIDTYVAESEAEAASLHLRRLQDDGLVGDIDPGMELVFTLVGDDAQITIDVDDVGGPRKLTLSAAEWAAQSPKGFLCSTEY
ncbi:MAG TPA: hypothetical protein VFF65_01515, partial [Phycisphaerales bacterium]|nr:hypothetical protein [Phycisphaerales bacterium]